MNPNQIHYLKDYTPPSFMIEEVFLHFDLYDEHTIVKSILHIRKNPVHEKQDLTLDGEELHLIAIWMNGEPLQATQYRIDLNTLTIFSVPDQFTLEIECQIQPQNNTRLSGLYKTGGKFCTQCESQGFRRITYFLDRPDVLTRFTTSISADRTQYPILLSNGNLVDSRALDNNRHWVKWIDPTRKPSYLFALVAGDFEVLEDIFITQSSKKIKLQIFVESGKKEQAIFAMSALKQAMRWDEENYRREYDLEIYMIVAVSDFNFGAMENKGLNIFNDKYILAQPETATDEDFVNVQAVVAHEYFHNWSGNRVTVRDWFQITLKEGLTVFREHQFTADQTSETVKRIQDVKNIRSVQFAQDASPMAHPIQPDSYLEINNFYTTTVYDKGAEVIRMLHTLLGVDLFSKAMDIYFSRHDGLPVTVEEFVESMEEASGRNLTQFRRWYRQAGTPVLNIEDHYDIKKKIYQFTVSQTCPSTPGQPIKEPFHIPFSMGLLDSSGKEIPLILEQEKLDNLTINFKTRIFEITKPIQTFCFIDVSEKPVPSFLRHFSAPVKLNYDYTDEHLLFLFSHDSDGFNRWEAGQKLATRILIHLIRDFQENKPLSPPIAFLKALRHVLKQSQTESAVMAEIITLPTQNSLMEEMVIIDPEASYQVHTWLKKEIASYLQAEFEEYYQKNCSLIPYTFNAAQVGDRKLKNLVLSYLTTLGEKKYYKSALSQFEQANNMTDAMGAAIALNAIDCPQREELMSQFYFRWQKDSLVINKWLSLQATSTLPKTLEVVKELTQQVCFNAKNPNSVRSLIGAFVSNNPYRFHQSDGSGYEFLTEWVLKIDPFNPQLASRILEPLIRWKRFDSNRQQLMKAQLEHMAKTPNLSKDISELITKSLS